MNPRQFLYRIAFTIARSIALPHHDQPKAQMHWDPQGREAVYSLGGSRDEPAQMLETPSNQAASEG